MHRGRLSPAQRWSAFNYRLSNVLYEATRQSPGPEQTLRWVREINIQTHLPDVSWPELQAISLRRREITHPGDPPTRETPETLGMLAPYVYLKHECTNYDRICDQLRGRSHARLG